PPGGACDIGAFEAAPIPAPTHFVIGSPSFTTAGVPTSVTVTAKDAAENTVLSYTGVIHFASTDAQAILPGNYTFTGGGGDNGVHIFTGGATFKIVGNQTLTVTDVATSSIAGNVAVAVNPATAARFTVGGFASPNVAGATGSFTVTAIDAFGNIATDYTGTVQFSSSDPQADLPRNYAFVGGDAGIHTFTNAVILKTAGTQSIIATDTVTSSITGSQSITITSVGGIASFVVTGYPSPIPVNTANGFTVIAKDAYGNTASAYRGTVQFFSTDATATLPGTYVFTAADAGVHLFTATMKTVGNRTLTVTDTTNGSVTGNQAVTVTAATANHLSVSVGTTPQSAVIGHTFPIPLAIAVQDAFNNPVGGIAVTFAAPGNGARGFFGGSTTTATANTDSSGMATAPPFTAGSVAGSYTIVVIVAGIGISTPFALTNLPDSADHFVPTGAPSVQAGIGYGFSATATDSGGNIATGYRGTVHLTSNDPQASLPSGDYLFTDADNGVHSFSVILRSAGSHSVTVMDTGPAAANGTLSFAITAAPARTISANASSTPQTATIGVAFSAPFAVAVIDTFNNPVNNVSVTFTAPGSGASGSFAGGGNPTVLTSGNGIATAPQFTANSITGGYPVLASVTGLSGVVFSLTNSAGLPGLITVTTGNPQSVTINTSFGASLSATVKDGSNNRTPNVVVTFVAPGGSGASGTFLGGAYTVNVTTDSSGTATAPAFTANTTAGSYTVSASAPGVGSPATFSLTNNPGAASALAISFLTNPSPAGITTNFTVTARDAFGNTATDYVGAVHFTSADAQAAMPMDYPFIVVDLGSHSFAVTFKSIGAQVLTATDSNTHITGNQPMQVIPGPVAAITVSGYPSPVAVNGSNAFTVSIRDALGNTASGYLGTVRFTSTDTQMVLPANYAFTTADQGTHSFVTTFKAIGTQTLTAKDSAASSITGSQSGIIVTSGAGTHLTLSAPTTAKAGTAFSVTVTARDALENTVTDYTRTVRFTSGDPLAGLPPDYTFVAADGGTHVFTVLLKTAGSRTVTVTDLSVSTVTGGATVTVSGPVITGVTPLSGPFGVGTTITVSGINLTGASVSVGGNTCVGVAVNSGGTSLTCNAPSHAAGTVDLIVTTNGGSATLNNAFTYVPASLPPAPPPRTGGGSSGGTGVLPAPVPAHR
nr:IPT/TIG domain-containing protein [Chloroflexota bacterium]